MTEPTRNQVGLRLGEMLPGTTDNGESGVPVTGRPVQTTRPANDDAASIPFAELVERSGIDEDTLLKRLAGILSRREETDDPE